MLEKRVKSGKGYMRLKDFPKIERPREKLERYGPEKLSTSELLAILLRTGSEGVNVIELANKILKKFSGSALSKANVNELKNTFGLGSAKACEVAACFELGRRLLQNEQSALPLFAKEVEGELESLHDGQKTKAEKIGKARGKYSVVSLFSGCGGLDLGFREEGFRIKWANDSNHWACETYNKNFGDHIIERDIADIRVREVPGSDIILGGFPCQDFSMIWKRGGIETERGNLYRHFVRIVKAKKPLMFIGENVKGLLNANGGKAIQQIKSDFGKAGYEVSVEKINLADYGAPQLRERVLIIGVRRDLGKTFELPHPTHNESSYVTAKEALQGVERSPHNNELLKISQKTVEMLKLIPPGGNFAAIPRNSPYYVKGMISHVYRRLHPDKPSTTIIAGGGGGTWGYHYDQPRPLTNRERARLFGYPDDFVFSGSVTEVRRQIGNSVPPAGIRPVAKAIYKFLQTIK